MRPAPQLQPDFTGHETTGAQALGMGDSEGDIERANAHAEDEPALPDLNPLRQAGWIFHDGECIAIERQGEELRLRVLAD